MTSKKMEFRFNSRVIMEETFKSKIDWFSSNYEKEIGGFIIGRIEKDKIVLEDLIIPKQEVTTGNIKFKAKDLVMMRKKHGDRCLKILGEWHSHNNLGAFWSGTDNQEFIEPFSAGREFSIFVVSSNAKHLVRIELRNQLHLSLDKIRFEVQSNEEIEKECLKEIEENVNEAVYSYGGDNNSYDYSQDWKDNPEQDGKLFNDPNLKVTKIENMNADKIDVKQHISYYGTQNLDLINLSWFIGNALYEEYKQFNPRLIGNQESSNSFSLNFEFSSKEHAVKMLKRLKKSLAEQIIEEESVYRGGY